MIVLDTDVVSELMGATPAPAVLAWLGELSGEYLYTTAVTVAEIRYGIARLPEGRRRAGVDARAVREPARRADRDGLGAARAGGGLAAGPGAAPGSGRGGVGRPAYRRAGGVPALGGQPWPAPQRGRVPGRHARPAA